MGLTYEVAKFVTEKGFKDFSKEDIQAAKGLLLGSIGEMIKGVPERVTQIVINYAKDSGGTPECGIIGAKFKTSLTQAALVNGTAHHAVELESAGLYTGCDPMSNMAVALGVAEKFALSGKAVIEGIVIGLEVQTRLGISGPGSFDKGFSSIPLYGTLGAATTAGKMMNMSAEQMQHAYGIGISQCSGQQRQRGTMGHLLENGIGCRNGVTAAILAKSGMRSDPDLIEGPRGFYDLFCSSGHGYNLENTVRTLGNPFCVAGSPYVKIYGICVFGHRAVEALVLLKQEHNIRYEDVRSVHTEVPQFVAEALRFPDPVNSEQAQFSLEQALGAVLVDEVVELPYLQPFTDEGAIDPKYQEARKKIEVTVRNDWSGGRSKPWSTPVTVVMKSGEKYTKTVDKDQLKGSPSNPLTWDELVARHKALVSDFLSAAQTDKSVELVSKLENLDSITELMKLITYGKAN